MRSEDDLGALVYLCNLAGAQVAGQNTDGREKTQLGQLGASKDAVEKGGGGERETERERDGDCKKHNSPTGHDVGLTSQPACRACRHPSPPAQ